jgi:hypothetical protein
MKITRGERRSIFMRLWRAPVTADVDMAFFVNGDEQVLPTAW